MAAGSATGGDLELHTTMRLQRLGSIVVIQPSWRGEVAGPSLTCDLETGTLALAEHPKVGVVAVHNSGDGWRQGRWMLVCVTHAFIVANTCRWTKGTPRCLECWESRGWRRGQRSWSSPRWRRWGG